MKYYRNKTFCRKSCRDELENDDFSDCVCFNELDGVTENDEEDCKKLDISGLSNDTTSTDHP